MKDVRSLREWVIASNMADNPILFNYHTLAEEARALALFEAFQHEPEDVVRDAVERLQRYGCQEVSAKLSAALAHCIFVDRLSLDRAKEAYIDVQADVRMLEIALGRRLDRWKKLRPIPNLSRRNRAEVELRLKQRLKEAREKLERARTLQTRIASHLNLLREVSPVRYAAMANGGSGL